MRSLDVSAFDPVGVNQIKLRFLEAFAAFCVLRDSPSIEPGEQAELDGNHALVARRGREPGLALRRDGRDISLADWALEIVDSMRGVCELLDEGDPDRPYLTALEMQEAKVRDPARTPAARTLLELHTTGESFFNFALRMSRQHKAYFLELYSPNEARQAEFAAQAEHSLAEQARIESARSFGFRPVSWAILHGLTRHRVVTWMQRRQPRLGVSHWMSEHTQPVHGKDEGKGMNRKFDLCGVAGRRPGEAVAGRAKSGGVESAASSVRRDPSATGAWDPYEVWLTRVKQPRDRRFGPVGSS